MISKLKKMLGNPYTFSMVAKVFGVVVGFLFTIFQSRYLGAEIKGQVATVNSIVSITSIVFGLGIYHAYPYYKRNSEEDIMPIFMTIALILLCVYSIISVAIVSLLKLSAKYISVLILTPLLTYDCIVSYITLIEVPNKRSATDIAVFTAELIMMVILWLTAEPSFIIGVIIIAAKDVAKATFFTIWWKKRLFAPMKTVLTWFPKLVRFGFFPMLSLLMSTLNYRVDVLMLNGHVADAAIGVYSVGVLLAERVWMVPDAMKGVMVSHISKGKGAEEVAYVIRICNTICLVIIAGIIIVGKPFIDFLFGAEYSGAYQVTLILLAGIFSMIYYKLIASYNIVMGKQLVSFLLLGIGVITNIVANYILIPISGIYGAGIASIVSYAFSSLLFVIYFCRSTKISFRNMIIINKRDFNKIRAYIKK